VFVFVVDSVEGPFFSLATKAVAPERRAVIVALGWRSLVSGTLASMMSGAVVGLLV